MKPGKIKLILYFFILSSFTSLYAEDKILSAPIINLEKLEPSYENLENDKEITYKIVGNLESDPDNGHISIDTPIAKGLVGKFIDDEINIQTPSGNLNFEILEVKHI